VSGTVLLDRRAERATTHHKRLAAVTPASNATEPFEDISVEKGGALKVPGHDMDGRYGRVFGGWGYFDPDGPIASFTKAELEDRRRQHRQRRRTCPTVPSEHAGHEGLIFDGRADVVLGAAGWELERC